MRERTGIDSRNYIVALELRSAADCPADFYLPPAVAAFDAGVFLPRDDPDWFGRYAYPPQILLLCGDVLWAVPHPSAKLAPCTCGIEHLSFVESGHMLLKGWLAFNGAGFNYTAPYNTRGLPSVLRFMRRFRSRWLGAARLAASEVVAGDGLDVRFANALADELEPRRNGCGQLFPTTAPIRKALAASAATMDSRRSPSGDEYPSNVDHGPGTRIALAVWERRFLCSTPCASGSRSDLARKRMLSPGRPERGAVVADTDRRGTPPRRRGFCCTGQRSVWPPFRKWRVQQVCWSPRTEQHVMEPAARQDAEGVFQPDEEVRRLVACLQSLVEGQSAVEELAACGPKAIAPLREFLLSGRVTSVPQPRMWAVEALALLGARDVLIEYLQAPGRGVDAQLQFAEDAVRNTAGRRLSAWRDNETFEILLDFCRKRNLPRVIETVAEFERPDAIPCLDRALEDDMCRIAAEDGLRRLGPAARDALLLSAVTPLPNAEEEAPSSLCRRRSVLGLLTGIGLERRNWPELRPLLAERDPELLARLAQIASSVADPHDRASAAVGLVSALARLPWFVWKEAEEALVALAPESVPATDAELSRRLSNPPLVRACDEVLRTLLRVKTTLRELQ